MSRSWTERVRRALEPAACAGLALGRDYVGYAELAAAEDGWRVVALDEAKLEQPLFTGSPAPGAEKELAAALGRFSRAMGRWLPLHVSVPDALVRWGTFELDEVPKSAAARLDLVRFRFSRQGTNGSHACVCQALERDGDKHLLFGMALDDAWRGTVSRALADAGLVHWSVSGNACRQFNRYHDTLAQSSGALVALAPDAWSLWIWDDRGRPRYGRGRWRGPRDDSAAIAADVERAILAYVHSGRERAVGRVYVAGGADAGAAAAALDARMREPSVRLDANDGTAQGAPAVVASASVALAAALDR